MRKLIFRDHVTKHNIAAGTCILNIKDTEHCNRTCRFWYDTVYCFRELKQKINVLSLHVVFIKMYFKQKGWNRTQMNDPVFIKTEYKLIIVLEYPTFLLPHYWKTYRLLHYTSGIQKDLWKPEESFWNKMLKKTIALY